MNYLLPILGIGLLLLAASVIFHPTAQPADQPTEPLAQDIPLGGPIPKTIPICIDDVCTDWKTSDLKTEAIRIIEKKNAGTPLELSEAKLLVQVYNIVVQYLGTANFQSLDIKNNKVVELLDSLSQATL